MSAVFLIIVAVLALGLAPIVYGTIVKNHWGINVKAVTCPSCGTPVPRIRKPASREEAMWGGYTCPTCGCRMDKWGRPRPA